MSEPAITASAATGVALGITGTFLGVSIDVILFGFLAGIAVVAHTDDVTVAKGIRTVIISLVTAAAFSDFLALVVSGKVNIDAVYVRWPIAFTVGLLASAVIIPGLIDLGKWAFSKIKKVLGQKIDEVAK